MLSAADNERLTRVGPGTPMGELLRRYWHPIVALSELERRGVMPVRVLGEDLVLFRDKAGGLGLVGDRCGHRGAGLAFGIVDAGGLRCAYHGWLYDRGGRAVDMPLEGPDCPLRGKVGVRAHAVEALGGLVFAYLGPAPRPPLPRWDLLVWPNAIRQIGSYELGCNWLNAVENGLDPGHNHYLHGHFVRDRLLPDGVVDAAAIEAMRIDHNIDFRYVDVAYEPRSYGLLQTFRIARATGPLDGREARGARRVFNNLIFPCSTRKAGTIRTELQIRTPIDDTHTRYFTYQAYVAPSGHEVAAQASVPSYPIPIADADGRPALDHVMGQDAAIWCSQGAIADRTREHLVKSDAGILLYRRLLFEQLDVVAAGGEPMRPDAAETIELEPPCVPDGKVDETKLGYDTVYHDRFGPMIGEAMELVRRARAAITSR